MKNRGFLHPVICLALLCSCSSQSEISKLRLPNGFYKTRHPHSIPEQRYVRLKNDTIWAYLADRVSNKVLDTSRSSVYIFPQETSRFIQKDYSFSKKSWAFNFHTILFKYRPAAANIPNQLNTEFNFNLYLGRRSDLYRISYHGSPLGLYNRKIDHFGYSFGFFSGLGETPINSSVTQGKWSYAYDGVVWLSGLGVFIGINNFNLGIGFGMDQLLDRNRDIWIYQQKPWAGLLLGVKLK